MNSGWSLEEPAHLADRSRDPLIRRPGCL